MTWCNVVLVSVTESVQLLRERYRASAQEAISRHKGRGPLPFKSNEPDTSGFLHAIVEEIMDNGNTMDYAKRPGVGPAAMVLVKQGMSVEEAERTTVDVFNALVDEIAVHAPKAQFGENTGWYYEVEGDHDLRITMPTQLPRSPH